MCHQYYHGTFLITETSKIQKRSGLTSLRKKKIFKNHSRSVSLPFLTSEPFHICKVTVLSEYFCSWFFKYFSSKLIDFSFFFSWASKFKVLLYSFLRFSQFKQPFDPLNPLLRLSDATVVVERPCSAKNSSIYCILVSQKKKKKVR